MQNSLVNINGRIMQGVEGTVSVFDRGFLYGDSLYEVARTYGGKFFKLDDHLQRLRKSAELCRMDLSQQLEGYRSEIMKTYEAFQNEKFGKGKDVYCRIIVTRGSGRIGFGLKNIDTPACLIIMMLPVDLFQPTQQTIDQGISLRVAQRVRNDRRALDPAMKSGNYLNSVLAYLESVEGKFDDALLCNFDGHITEGTTFNIFYVRHGIVATPPLDIGILDGITRRFVIDLARKAGHPLREVRFTRERLYEADEVFVTSSLKECLAVTQIDDCRIGNGKPGPVTRSLRESFLNSAHSPKSEPHKAKP